MTSFNDHLNGRPGSHENLDPMKNPETFKNVNLFRKTKKSDNKPLSRTPVAFPLDAFPKGIQDIILETNRVLKFPVDFIATSILYTAAICIGNICKVAVNSAWLECCVFYFALVGPSGTMKSPPLTFALSPLNEIDANHYTVYKDERNRYNQQNSQTIKDKGNSGNDFLDKPVLKKHLVTDITKEALSEVHENNPRGIGVNVDELAAWFKNFNRYNNGSDQEFWLSTWSLKPIVVDRVGSGSRFIKDPFISVIGTIQSKLLYLMAKDDRGANGFIDRLLFAMPFAIKKEKWSREQLNPIVKQHWAGIVKRLIDFADELKVSQPDSPKVFKFSSPAFDILSEWQSKNADLSNGIDEDSIKGIYSKLEIYAIRFCLTLHLLEFACSAYTPDEIQPSTVNGALKLVEYFRDTALRVNDIINNRDPLDGQPVKNQAFYTALPVTFATKEAIQLGNDYGFAERTVKRMLNNEELFRWIRQGQYEKRL